MGPPSDPEAPMHRVPPVLRFATLLCFAVLAIVFVRSDPIPPASAGESASPYVPEVTEQDLRRRLTFFAADHFRGRDTIAPEAVRASDWIAQEWARMGLLPKGTDGGWFQPFQVPQPILGSGNLLRVTTPDSEVRGYAVEKEWNPFSVTGSGGAEGEVVFAGYGISAPGKPHDYDDYAGLDVKGKVVLVFRKNPGWREQRHAAFLQKLKVAAEKGAAALLLCNNPETTSAAQGEDTIGHWSASLGAPAGAGPIPYAFVSQDIARTLLTSTGKTLEELEGALRKDGPQSQLLPGTRVQIETALSTTKEMNARNVVGFLPGHDPDVCDEVVVLGAHYDHIGLGTFGSLGGRDAAGQIHNGADDNGSGSVSLLELAEWFGAPGNSTRRSLLFIAFTGEERGLLGSRHFVAHPTVPLDDIVAMLNMDMVGRSREGRMEIGGVGTAVGLKDIVAQANADIGMKVQWDPGGEAPTDSTSFFRKKIPVLFFFTGLHEDYHRPADDVERINFPDMLRIGHLVRRVARDIADADERLVYTDPPVPPRPPRIGIMPSPESDPRGIVVAQVPPNGPAGQAGMEAGDILVSLADHVVRDLQSLRAALGKLSAGKTVTAVILRADERITLKITLAAPR
jgi:aminopeptidase YwaD